MIPVERNEFEAGLLRGNLQDNGQGQSTPLAES
jgi:hypothetical protein